MNETPVHIKKLETIYSLQANIFYHAHFQKLQQVRRDHKPMDTLTVIYDDNKHQEGIMIQNLLETEGVTGVDK